jgi:hypothetical protein
MDSEFTKEFFDDASAAWRLNKKVLKGGFAYKCAYIHSNGKNCPKAVESYTNGRRLLSGHPEWIKPVGPWGDQYCRKHKRRWVHYEGDGDE